MIDSQLDLVVTSSAEVGIEPDVDDGVHALWIGVPGLTVRFNGSVDELERLVSSLSAAVQAVRQAPKPPAPITLRRVR